MARLIAVDANPASRLVQTGTERYALELCRRLPAQAPDLDWIFYASQPVVEPGVDALVLPMRRLWSQLRLPARLWRARPDLLFAPSHVVPFLAPGRALTVVHDLAFEHFPDAYDKAQLAYLRLTTRWAVRRCPELIAVSQATADDLVARYGVERSRVAVVHPGGGEAPQIRLRPVEAAERRRRLGVQVPYALHVGRVEPRKNQAAALAAVEQVPGLRLVSAGPVVDEAIAGRLRASGRCLVLGRVDGPDLEALYQGAAALVFPSLYEGFGFPVLEALRRGVPVVTVRASSLPEVGGKAALYAAGPDDVDGLAAGLRQALEEPDFGRRGPAQARRFTWERCAAGVVEVMRRLLAR
jgi:glycosyltransferase involved in cell wall biosynthesis